MKQTAVDWLFTKIWDEPKDKMTWFAIFQLAKQMEKEQIEEAFDTGLCDGYDYGFTNDSPTKENGQQYYKETFNSK
jgi:hypothetical protein